MASDESTSKQAGHARSFWQSVFAPQTRLRGAIVAGVLLGLGYALHNWQGLPGTASLHWVSLAIGLLFGSHAAWGVLREGNPLGRGGVVIAPDANGTPDAEPLDPNDTTLTGYFIIEVSSAVEAERIAASCPALTHGEVVHLRPVGHTD